jgi:hypothetical protein
MGKPVKRETKKPYAKPTLTVYGSVRELTQKVGSSGQKDKVGGGIKSQTNF